MGTVSFFLPDRLLEVIRRAVPEAKSCSEAVRVLFLELLSGAIEERSVPKGC